MGLLELSSVSKTYRRGVTGRSATAVRELSFDIRPREIVGFVGPNGSGKTTTIKMILGLVFPTAGSIRVNGYEPLDARSRMEVAYVSEQPYFYEHLTVDETLGFIGKLRGLRAAGLRKEAGRALDVVELSGIQGFDEDTAAEIQRRAQEHLARVEAEQEARRQELGVADELKEVDGVTTPMLVAFGENDIKTMEDLAGCATDDLVGWTDGKGPEAVRHKGVLDSFGLSRTEAEAIIMAARVKAGWIEPPAETEGSPEELETEAHPT